MIGYYIGCWVWLFEFVWDSGFVVFVLLCFGWCVVLFGGVFALFIYFVFGLGWVGWLVGVC